jgi:hypothetical protein
MSLRVSLRGRANQLIGYHGFVIGHNFACLIMEEGAGTLAGLHDAR